MLKGGDYQRSFYKYIEFRAKVAKIDCMNNKYFMCYFITLLYNLFRVIKNIKFNVSKRNI